MGADIFFLAVIALLFHFFVVGFFVMHFLAVAALLHMAFAVLVVFRVILVFVLSMRGLIHFLTGALFHVFHVISPHQAGYHKCERENQS